jgi:hypothetical protein
MPMAVRGSASVKNAPVVLAGHTSKTEPIEASRAGDRARRGRREGSAITRRPPRFAAGAAPSRRTARADPHRGRWEGSSRRRGNGVDTRRAPRARAAGAAPGARRTPEVRRTRSKRGPRPRPTGTAHALARSGPGARPAPSGVRRRRSRRRPQGRWIAGGGASTPRWFTWVSSSAGLSISASRRSPRLRGRTARVVDAPPSRRAAEEGSHHRRGVDHAKRGLTVPHRRGRSLPPGERLEVEGQARGVVPGVL